MFTKLVWSTMTMTRKFIYTAFCATAVCGQQIPTVLRPAEAYRVNCTEADQSCKAWMEFRTTRPFPDQTIQGERLPDNTVAVIVSEPAPALSKTALDQLIKRAFGADLISERRLRWRMGADGWLEDVVLHVRTAIPTGDPLRDPLFRDRVAFLHLALFGTAFGGEAQFREGLGNPLGQSGVPDLEISAREIHQWLTVEPLMWNRVDSVQGEPALWATIASRHYTGTYYSGDRSLVLLTFPVQMLNEGLNDPNALDPLRVPFRCFAVATDAIIGGFVSTNGSVALLGRPRSNSFSAAPPLRFETFKLVASEATEELSQSYERMSIFSGKLKSGKYRLHDWAPIYLSDSLIDTEFGALLNTTDQLLKSWSQGGSVEYLYFNYPKPAAFPFGIEGLSSLVEKQTGSASVLFNWNTAGSTVLVSTANGKVLTTRRTGALPVTYGSENSAHNGPVAGNLMTQEEIAYQYFARKRDPNLERVVQYTLLYQFCRAITGSRGRAAGDGTRSELTAGVKAERAGAAVKVAATFDFLRHLEDHQFQLEPVAEQETQKRIGTVRREYPGMSDSQMANLLADRFSKESKKIEDARIEKLTSLDTQLDRRLEQFNKDVAEFNAMIESARLSSRAAIDSAKGDIEARRQALKHDEAALTKMEQDDPVQDLRYHLYRLAMHVADTEAVRAQFVEAHKYEPDGSIKTPSIVLSWDARDLVSVGGHNIDARALRFEPNASVSGLSLKETEKGLVLEFNPSKSAVVESHAAELARAVEHGHVRNVSELTKIIADAPKPVRARSVALSMPKVSTGASRGIDDSWTGAIGRRVYNSKQEFVGDLQVIAEKNDCCIFIAHDANEIAFATEQNLKPPPKVVIYEIRDTPSMNAYLRDTASRAGRKGDRAVVFFDTTESHIEALGISATKTSETDLGEIAGVLGKIESGGRERAFDGVLQRDLNGKESTLRSILRVTEVKAKSLLARITLREQTNTWTRAAVTRVEGADAEAFVADIGWDTSRDGVPSAISLKFDGGVGKEPPVDVAVVAGYSQEMLKDGQRQLWATHEQTLVTAAARQASIAQYTMTLRNELMKMPDSQLLRLAVLVKEGSTRTLLSWNGEAWQESSYAR